MNQINKDISQLLKAHNGFWSGRWIRRRNKMLTLQHLKEMKPHTIFMSGVGMDGHHEVRWVAVRGGIYDWAIYYGKLTQSNEEIASHGDKFFTESKIKCFIPCDDEAFKMYRY